MNFIISNLGDVLISRPAGKEAFLDARAYIFDILDSSDTTNPSVEASLRTVLY